MVLQALQKVFRKPLYVLIAVTTSVVMFVFATWLPNIRLITSIVGSSDASLSQKIEIPISLLGSITTNFTVLSASYTVAIAILFGISLAMVVYVMKRKLSETKQSGMVTGFVGMASGVLGMGCAACGSLLLTSGLAFVGASGLLALLPLGGSEFGILGVILLSFSIYFTAKQIENPSVCRI